MLSVFVLSLSQTDLHLTGFPCFRFFSASSVVKLDVYLFDYVENSFFLTAHFVHFVQKCAFLCPKKRNGLNGLVGIERFFITLSSHNFKVVEISIKLKYKTIRP